ncbi:MAG: hypothetical protein AB7F36_10365, partial [Reyranellaceae bacterium]
MANQQATDPKVPDPEKLAKDWARLAERSQKVVADFLAKQAQEGPQKADPLNIGQAFLEMTQRMMANPEKVVQAQVQLWQDYIKLWQNTADRFMGKETKPLVEAGKGDKR